MIKRTEEDIKKRWHDPTATPLVSISCIAYNHEEFISQAIDGMLMQETTFPFEILIHDDASTDKTAEIISSYVKEYPTLIKPIYQTENQFSKGSDIVSFNNSRAKGEYIALCEGDDYWTDKEKLQFQISRMKEYNDCQISFHPATIQRNRIISDEVTARHSENDTVFDVKEIIKGDGGFCPTASIIFKKEVIENPPDFFKDTPAGDYFLQILGSIDAGALYINRTMSTYRIHQQGVWTSTARDYNALKLFISKMSKSLEEMDRYYDHQYHKEIEVVESNLIARSISKVIFHINDRIDLYDTYKLHLTTDQLVEIQQRLISDQTELIHEQIKEIKDMEKQCRKFSSEIELVNDHLNLVVNSVQKIAMTKFIRNPFKKYKAYKEMLSNIYNDI